MEQVCRAPPLGGITTNPGGVYPDHQQGWWLSQVAVICGCTYLRIFQAYKKGMVKEEQITRAAEHLMTIRIMLGEFDEENE